MNTLIKLYCKIFACGVLLLSLLGLVSPAHAEFGIDALELSPVRILTTGNSTQVLLAPIS